MKYFSLLLIGILLLCNNLDALPKGKPTASFSVGGTIKIVQFTDVHFVPNDRASEHALELIRKTLTVENPDLVVFTGDVVTGEPVREGWKSVLAPVVETGAPFAVTLGNHDDEHGMSRQEIRNLLNDYPSNLFHSALNVSSEGDFVLPIKEYDSNETAALLYFFDSNAYSTLPNVEGYGWFKPEQINWYRHQSRKLNSSKDEKFPALAFFHIPLPEYREAINKNNIPLIGQRNEDECSPDINTGMFSAILQAGDILGTFVGHDHVNDYIVDHYGIALAYGRFSGGKTTYGDLLNGARILVLKQDKREFETWVRLRNGAKENHVTFPDDFRDQ